MRVSAALPPYVRAMFLPPDQRAIPPRWEPSRKPGRPDRGGNAAVILVVLMAVGPVVATVAAFAPIVVLVFRMLAGRQ